MKRFIMIIAAAICLAVFTGCSASSGKLDGAAPMASAAPAADTAAQEAHYADDMYAEEAYEAGVDEAEASGLGELPNINIPDTNRKLVYTSTITIDSKHFDEDYKTITDALESELSDVLYDLDQLKGSKRGMDRLVEYSRIDVYLNEVISAETVTTTGDPLGERAANAYNMSLTGVGKFLQNAAVFFAGAAPVLILTAVIAIIIFGIVKLIKLIVKKLRTKKYRRDVINGKTEDLNNQVPQYYGCGNGEPPKKGDMGKQKDNTRK